MEVVSLQGFVDEALVMFHTAAAQEHAASLNALGIIAEEGQNGCQKDLKVPDRDRAVSVHFSRRCIFFSRRLPAC